MQYQKLAHQALLCFALIIAGCTNKYEDYTPTIEQVKSHSPCKTIKQQLNAVYSPEIGTRPTAIQRARLLQEYEIYNCQG